MRLGRASPRFEYEMIDQTGMPVLLEQSVCEKDLGVHVDQKMNFSTHVYQATAKANRLLGVIRRAYKFLDEETLLCLYKGLVRPSLEYGVIIWSPYLKKDQDAVEAVQRRATRLVPGLQELPYEERLRRLQLPTLTYRRSRGDMIQVYKYLHGLYKVQSDILPRAHYQATSRGHALKLEKRPAHHRLRQSFFTQGVTDLWKSLPSIVISAASMNVFNKRLDHRWKTQPFLYDYRAPFVAERMHTTDNFLSQEYQDPSIGEVAWSTEADRYR